MAFYPCDMVENGFQVHSFILPIGWLACQQHFNRTWWWLDAKPWMAPAKSTTDVIFSVWGYSATILLTCCEIEKPIIISPSGTSQETVAESARRCMTDTLTGAGGLSGRKETETEGSVNPPAPLDIRLPSPSVSTPHLERLKHCVGTLNAAQVFVSELNVNKRVMQSGLWMN